ncbi:MAG: amino acid permease [Akkermansiaceae bacterium]|nr:amino acid permease [Akkermansiaceae bacterium]NNM31396.1 amino acid permease [Akkermansiaceae bacterium]
MTARAAGVTLLPATAIVVGNMIGTGIFTSLGFQVADIRSGFVLMTLWVLGGVFALCGALCYGELAAALPRSGGEYHFLGRIYHPAVGFLAGWVSATVGFAAPVALVAMAFGEYLASATPVPVAAASGGVVAVVAGVHLCEIRIGGRFQSVFTLLKVGMIVMLAGAFFVFGEDQGVRFLPGPGDAALLVSAPFAVALVFVMYAYSGWNAATYVVNDVRDPQRTVPRALFAGTLLVTVLYIGLNAAFLHAAPMEILEGEVEVAQVAAEAAFGSRGGSLVALLICLGLLSSLSAMTWAGPRVAVTMGEDYRPLRWLAVRSKKGVPYVAVLWQTAIVYLLLIDGTFEAVLVYIELLLILSGFLTVAGVIWLRWREPGLERPYRAWGYPLTPVIFLGISAWMIVYMVRAKPVESGWSLATLVAGALVYLAARRG